MPDSNIKKGVGLGFGGAAGVVLFVIVLVIIGVASSGSEESNSSTTNSTGSTAPKATEALKGKVEVKSEQLKKADFGREIVGEVINNGTSEAMFVKIIATFYDKDNKVTDTDFTYAGDTSSTPLKAGETAPFEIMILDNNTVIDHYKLDVKWD